MVRPALLLLLAALTGCRREDAAGAPAPMAVEEPFASPAALPGAIARDIVRWTNRERMARGLPPAMWSEALARAAHAHTAEMHRLRYFEHDSPDPANRTVLLRVRNAGLRARTFKVGENLAKGTWRRDRARRIVQEWMASERHRQNVLWPSFRFIGVAVWQDGAELLVTQVLASAG
jgi:uncharacterized protein YkwD